MDIAPSQRFAIKPENPFELLKNLGMQVENLNSKISQLERKIDEKIPEISYDYYDAATENSDFSSDIKLLHEKIMNIEKKFEEESYDPGKLLDDITHRIKEIVQKPLIPTANGLTAVEGKRIEKIIHLLERHEKLTSNELSEMLELSRTRCNEYFKMLERMNMVEFKVEGKEKYYLLKG